MVEQIWNKEKKCVICARPVTGKRAKGKAKTCNQSCAGKLAWKSRTN